MITDFFLNLIFNFLNFLLKPIAEMNDVVFSGEFTSSIQTFSSFVKSLDSVIPIDTLLTILGILLTMEGVYLIYKVIMWVIKKIPFIN